LTDEEIKNTFLNTNTIKGAFQLEGEECRAESNTPSTVFEVSPTTTKTKLIKLKEHLAGDMNPLPSPDEILQSIKVKTNNHSSTSPYIKVVYINK